MQLYTFISNVNRGKYLNSILVPGSLEKTEKSFKFKILIFINLKNFTRAEW